jgi:hypothetical protein
VSHPQATLQWFFCKFCVRQNSVFTLPFESMMIHSVFFWLSPDLSADQRALFEEELRLLAGISYLKSATIGKPAPTPARPVTDHSFDYSLTVEFHSLKDHDFYQDECPDHKRFVDTCKPFFAQVKVYDSVSI